MHPEESEFPAGRPDLLGALFVARRRIVTSALRRGTIVCVFGSGYGGQEEIVVEGYWGNFPGGGQVMRVAG